MNRAERRRGAPAAGRGPNRTRIILFATLGVIAIGIIVVFARMSSVKQSSTEATTMAHLTIGQQAPAFAVSTTGGPFSFPNADKKPVLLEVFATWCPHCQHETAELNKLFDKYGKNVDIVAVSGNPYAMDGTSAESAADVVEFTQRFNTRYPVAYDPELKVMNAYLQGGYPTIVVIDRHGKVFAIRNGEITAATLGQDLDAALKS